MSHGQSGRFVTGADAESSIHACRERSRGDFSFALTAARTLSDILREGTSIGMGVA